MTNSSSDYEELNKQIDDMLSSEDKLQEALHSADPELQVAARLTNSNHPVLPDSVRQSILEELHKVKPVKSTQPLRPDFGAWIARIAAVLVIAIAASFAAQPVAAESLPGDVLYPVKLTFEQMALRFANSPEALIETHLNQAEERLWEIEQLPSDSDLTNTTLESAVGSVQAASVIAGENAIFESDIVLLEEAQATLLSIEQKLAAITLPADALTSIQLSLNAVREQLPDTTILETTPEVTEAPVELTEEATEAPVVLTEEATEAPVEPTAEVTEAPVEVTEPVSEETPEASPEPDTTVIEDDNPDLIAVDAFGMYIYPGGRVNLRSGAGTDFDVVGTANQNTPVTVIGQNAAGDWYLVRLPNGTQGWIFVNLLDDTPGQSNNSNVDNSTGNSNGNGNGNATGSSNSNSAGNANGNSAGNANGNSSGNANGNSAGNANGNSAGKENGRGN